MTAQRTDVIVMDGGRYSLCTEPLQSFLQLLPGGSPFESDRSDLIRGYVCTWEVDEDRLYLVDLGGTYRGGVPATLESLFPGSGGKVLASWYTGTIWVARSRPNVRVAVGYPPATDFIRITEGVRFRPGKFIRQRSNLARK